MTTSLTQFQIDAYQRDGILFPFRALSESEAAEALRKFEQAREEGYLNREQNLKSHMLAPWLDEIARHPAILDAVEGVIGPNILCWGSGFFAKKPRNDSFVSWHQDSTYWDLSSPEVVTAWVAFTPSTPENGNMQVVPGTHTRDQVPHRDTFAPNNMLSRGQEVAVEVDPQDVLDVTLAPGEFSLHHVRIFHGSEGNRSDISRIGYAIRYIPTHVRQLGGRTTASLVRGVDDYHYFDEEPQPTADFSAEALAAHDEAMSRLASILMRDAPTKIAM